MQNGATVPHRDTQISSNAWVHEAKKVLDVPRSDINNSSHSLASLNSYKTPVRHILLFPPSFKIVVIYI